jgi:ribonuclease Z
MTQMQIIFLGTGGSWPTVKKNVTSLAIKRGCEIILFDCGEGTQRQFQKSNLSYMQIAHIFISHFHGDHFLGLPGLIQTMQLNDRDKPLHIYGPSGMKKLADQLLSLGYFRPSFKILIHEIFSGDTINFREYTVEVLTVIHNVPAFAYCLEEKNRPGKFNKPKALKLGIPEGHLFSKLQKGQSVTLKDGRIISSDMILGPPRKGRKIVFSGDTKPFDQMISFAQNADVLIHEATFDSELKDIAFEYGHSTAAQAADIAKKANVDSLYLVHSSPRYLNTKCLEDEAKKIFNNSFFPKDFFELDVKLKK